MRGDFTLSYHFFRPKDRRNHLELFLDTDGESPLETWRHDCRLSADIAGARRRFHAAEPHRRIYLEYAGRISNQRGCLRILRRGKFIDRRTRMSEVFAMHEAYSGENRRARRLEVSAAHDVHLGANRRKQSREVSTILVTL